MDVSIYKKLQDNFVMIRFLNSGIINDTESLDNAKNNIMLIRTVLKKECGESSNSLLIYCIDTLFEVTQENNQEKTSDFADLIHNMPEIYLGKRNIKSFKREIRKFNKKYKTKYFNEYVKLFSPKAV